MDHEQRSISRSFDRDVAAFIIACYISDLRRWSDDGYDENLSGAIRLASDLGVTARVEHELRGLGWVAEESGG